MLVFILVLLIAALGVFLVSAVVGTVWLNYIEGTYGIEVDEDYTEDSNNE